MRGSARLEEEKQAAGGRRGQSCSWFVDKRIVLVNEDVKDEKKREWSAGIR